jgi:hypothetical protein
MSTICFTRDETWNIFEGLESVESFKKSWVHSFRFKKEVPTEVVKGFEIVQKLLLHSYAEYNFLDPALTKALTSFEMALHKRFQEVQKKEWSGNLMTLMKWFNSEGYFEFECEPLLNVLRNRRNILAHPKKHMESGIILMNCFKHCNSLINDLYENREKRKLRNEETGRINKFLDELVEAGAVIQIMGKRKILYRAGVFFINNKQQEKKIYCYFKTIFDSETTKTEPIVIFFEGNDRDLKDEDALSFVNNGDGFISIEPIVSESEIKEYENWKLKFKEKEIYWAINASASTSIDNAWYQAKNDFHFGEI